MNLIIGQRPYIASQSNLENMRRKWQEIIISEIVKKSNQKEISTLYKLNQPHVRKRSWKAVNLVISKACHAWALKKCFQNNCMELKLWIRPFMQHFPQPKIRQTNHQTNCEQRKNLDGGSISCCGSFERTQKT